MMTGGLIMRPNHRWTPLHVSILAVLFLSVRADGNESVCEPGVKVRRNTKYKPVLGEKLRIECPVSFCSAEPPAVFWFKDEQRFNVSSDGDIKTEWRRLTESEGMSYLIFQNIHRNHDGLYQCEMLGNMGHNINVSVNEDAAPGGHSITTQKTNTSSPLEPETNGNNEIVKLYMYCAAGIASFVIIVIIISVILMRGCKGKSKKKTQAENQYAMISHANRHPSPRGSPCVLPPRRSSKKKTPSRQPAESRSSRDSELMKDDRDSRAAAPDVEDGSVVYAALNHDVPHRPAGRPQRIVEEASEYAAIRVG